MTTIAAIVETIIPIMQSPSKSSQLTNDDHVNTLEILWCQVSPLTAVQKCFNRGLYALRAAHLNQRVVVAGGEEQYGDPASYQANITRKSISSEMRYCVEFFT